MENALQGKRILLGITGGIAAYKSILLLRMLVQAGAEVKVVMTPAARQFVSPLVLATLSKQAVLVELAEGDTWANHVMLGRWAHLMLIAPATCNTIAKMASGLCDNLFMAVQLSATCPVMLAPAMDEDMWKHPATRRNIQTLAGYGYHVLPVATGALASGLHGEGRLLEPVAIMDAVQAFFASSHRLIGKKAVVTAGPTYEPLDPVRFIGNHSTGLMGIEIANALALAGADVTLVLGPTHLQALPVVKTIPVQTATQMLAAVQEVFAETDIAVMAAAVADYRPAAVADQKIKKGADELNIQLVKNPDILAYCGGAKTSRQLVVGFALETNNELNHAQEKLRRKNADLIVLNSPNKVGSGFGTPTNEVTIVSADSVTEWPLASKQQVAHQLVGLLAEKLEQQQA